MMDRSRSPFPGMDPYLEQSWPDVHHRLCTYSCDMLRTALPAGLIARLNERTIIEGEFDDDRIIVPDVRVIQHGRPEQRPSGAESAATAVLAEPLLMEVKDEPVTEGFVQVIDTRNGSRVVTVIEFTSPANKGGGEGRQQYRQKQQELTRGGVSLVEVDLLRSGRWNTRVPRENVPLEHQTPYHVCVTRGWQRMRLEFYPVPLRERLPAIRVPLRRTDADVRLDLQALIDLVYLNGSYGYDVDYSKPPVPPLDADDEAWAREVVTPRLAG